MFDRHMGVHIVPSTDPEEVKHVSIPGYVPHYTVRDAAGEIIRRGPVNDLVRWLHAAGGGDWVILYEDEFPVMECYLIGRGHPSST